MNQRHGLQLAHSPRLLIMIVALLLVVSALFNGTTIPAVGGSSLSASPVVNGSNGYPPPGATPSPTATVASYPPPSGTTPSPTATVASYPPPAEETPTPTATSTPQTPPVIFGMRPDRGREDLPNEVNIYGKNFTQGTSVKIGTEFLSQVNRIDSAQLRALVPVGLLSPGLYDLTVMTLDGQSATQHDAYRVLPSQVDDLFGNSYELWTDPVTLIEKKASRLGLVVHRVGGKQTTQPVEVSFYLGDPNAGGTYLGDGVTAPLPPHSSWSTSAVAWTPHTVGYHTIYAVIDPADKISETLESNNVVSRTLRVWPLDIDQTPPRVDSFTINNGAASTSEVTVTLAVSASDPTNPPPSSGMRWVLFLEQEFVQGAGFWVPAQSSGWLDYSATPSSYAWTLLPSAGAKYIQAWAEDRAGNISLLPHADIINYIPASDSVAQGESRVYRYSLHVGDRLTVRVEPLNGDPDLYVWAPDYNDPTTPRPPWVSDNLDTTVEQVSFIAPVDGTYQVEIYGYTAAEYRLTVNVTATVGVAADALPDTVVPDAVKEVPTEPIVPLDNEPSGYQGLPAAQRVYSLYLPLVFRGTAGSYHLYLPLILRRTVE